MLGENECAKLGRKSDERSMESEGKELGWIVLKLIY